MFEDYNFGKGVTYKYIDFQVDENLSFEEQCWSYKQDMLNIEYNEGAYQLDVGWYSCFNPSGTFKIVVIKDNDWETPVKIERCREMRELVEHMERFVAYIQEELGKQHQQNL